ncbi:MAG: hypothetical protein DMF82_07235 [Acidobacteria bacterium]|nr:MAG: hypothetical protein DMF82_07235 [Acidobacteriota bacterium]
MTDYALSRFKVKEVRYRWSAQVVEPVDGLPFIGRNTPSAHVYVGTGYCGTGMTFGTLAAMIASDLILGRDNPWAQRFEARRIKPVAAARDFAPRTWTSPSPSWPTASRGGGALGPGGGAGPGQARGREWDEGGHLP